MSNTASWILVALLAQSRRTPGLPCIHQQSGGRVLKIILPSCFLHKNKYSTEITVSKLILRLLMARFREIGMCCKTYSLRPSYSFRGALWQRCASLQQISAKSLLLLLLLTNGEFWERARLTSKYQDLCSIICWKNMSCLPLPAFFRLPLLE